jgi:fucose 4-O-acetylase-like acetyltransferase
VSSTLNPVAAAPAAPALPRTRLSDLDRAKGLAILLVVFGHLVARQDPQGVVWYEPLRIAVYLFHMPLFMYLSGYVTFLSGAARRPLSEWPRLARRRAERLLLPFVSFGVLIVAAKLIAAHFFAVDNVPASLAEGLRTLVWDTERSPATSVWYVFVLFTYCLATPLFLALPRGRAVLVAVAAALFVAPLPPTLYLDRIGTYMIFFVAGGLAADTGIRWRNFIDALWLPALALLVAVVLPVALGWVQFEWQEGAQGFPYKWALLLAGLLSLPAVHGLVRHGAFARSSGLVCLGRYVFVIYLLNTIFIGIAKALLLEFTTWDGTHFLPFALALMMAGTLGPILTKRLLLRHFPALDRATD